MKAKNYFLAAIAIPLIALVCNSIAQEPKRESRNPSSLEVPVSKGSLARIGTEPNKNLPPSSGWIQFDNCMVFEGESVEIAFQDAGVIASLDVQENEPVGVNKVIATLDGENAKIEKEVAIRQASLATATASIVSDIELAQSIVEETKNQAEQYATMHARGNASQSENTQKQIAVKQAEVRLIQCYETKKERELKAQLAQTSVTLSQQKLERLTLRSPISGTVTRIDHRPGEWILAGTTVVKIVRLDEVRIDCFINDEQIDRTKLKGRLVKVILKRDGSELLFAGRITSFDQEINAAGQIKVHATVPNQKSNDNWLLLPRMSVTMQLQKPQ